jgi:tetratricopeptide (TPR) repeat protein
MDGLAAQLAQLSAEEVRALLAASGHAGVAGRAATSGSSVPDSAGAGDGGVSLSAEERSQQAQKLKDEGNASFRLGRFEEAARAYSRCLELDSSNAVCLSNRAAALLKVC